MNFTNWATENLERYLNIRISNYYFLKKYYSSIYIQYPDAFTWNYYLIESKKKYIQMVLLYTKSMLKWKTFSFSLIIFSPNFFIKIGLCLNILFPLFFQFMLIFFVFIISHFSQMVTEIFMLEHNYMERIINNCFSVRFHIIFIVFCLIFSVITQNPL